MRILLILKAILIATLIVATAEVYCATQKAGMSADTYAQMRKLDSAKEALETGLPSLTESISVAALSDSNISEEVSQEFKLLIPDALIAQGKYEQALTALFALEDISKTPYFKIRAAIINLGLKRTDIASEHLRDIDVTKISSSDLAWYYLARGYIFYERGDIKRALEEFEMAKKNSSTKFAAVDAEIALSICSLASDLESIDIASISSELESKTNLYMGTPAGFQFAKQYVAFLLKSGNLDKALEVVDSQLSIQLASESDRDDLKLMKAAMVKSDSVRREVLEDILNTAHSGEVAEKAISILNTRKLIQSEDLEKFLKELLESGNKNIKDCLIVSLSKISLRKNDFKSAAKYASRIMEEFPASKYRYEALRILAWAATSENPPEYRLAARYLEELAELESNEQLKSKTLLACADCYFLNKDYSASAKIYEELFDSLPSQRGMILNRAVDSYLALDDDSSATRILEKAYRSKSVQEDDIWIAIEKLILKLKTQGKLETSLSRLESSISSDASFSEIFKLRILWLRASNMEAIGDYAESELLCRKIIADISKLSSEKRKVVADIGANSMLMLGRILDSLNNVNDASKVFTDLRRMYPKSEAAELSYLYQARSLASRGKFTEAQKLCVDLIKANPKSPHFYNALFDSAQYAHKTGFEENSREAVKMLERLCKEFPENPRNFYARLSQAEIMRRLNAFGDARTLYRDIINNYQSHPEIHLAWLGLADSILVQSNGALEAAVIYERIYSLPNMKEEARAEAAYKWAYALSHAGKDRQANEARWVTASEILRSGRLSGKVRYWVGRSLMELADSLENLKNSRDARSVYELIVKYGLPSSASAQKKLNSK